MMTKNMTEPFLESTASSLMEEVSVFTHPSPEKDVLPSACPNQLQPAANPVSRMDLNPV